MGKKVLIVGGVAGGASTAARLRRLDESAEIIMFERDEHISFANCGLPYYLGGVIKERNSLFVGSPQKMKNEFNIDVRIFSEVTQVDPASKTITVKSRDRGVYQESYDCLVLSPGAKPLRPPIPGLDHPKILTLRNVADTDALKKSLDQSETRRVVVIGGGFIGVEMAENLRHKGLAVTLVEAVEHILAPFDPDMAVFLEKEMEDHGVRLILGDGVKAFHELENHALRVELASGLEVETDLVVLAIGVAPDTAFLKDSGLELGPRGHLVVNKHLQTSDPSVYAVGDAVEISDFILGHKTAIPLAGPANLQGRIAADNLAGLETTYQGAIGSSIIKIFALTAAATGHNERSLKRLGHTNYKVAYAHPADHATYYPGATNLALKLIYDQDGRILGAQGLGHQGVDKRIDVLATAIKLGGRVSDLVDLELCYAPPYSSAKDPVNVVAYVAENTLANIFTPITYQEFQALDRSNLTLLDVRFEPEYNLGHLPGAINIPLEQIRERFSELDREKTIVIYCKIGRRSYMAARILSHHGFKTLSIHGGYATIGLQNFKPTLGEPAASPEPAPAAVGDDSSHPFDHHLEATGLSCPGPLLKVKEKMDELLPGQVLKITASDQGFYTDVAAWCTATKNELLHREKGATITAFVKKTTPAQALATPAAIPSSENKTMVLFSNDLDKVLASLIIANGALAMHRKVTVFFTFWGLSVLRKPSPPSLPKTMMEKMFGWMLPRGTARLPLSKMNMLGLGSAMMRGLMKSHQVPTVEELLASLIEGGAELVACQMSMDIMGFKREELIDNITVGGVGHYLGRTGQANMNLFI